MLLFGLFSFSPIYTLSNQENDWQIKYGGIMLLLSSVFRLFDVDFVALTKRHELDISLIDYTFFSRYVWINMPEPD